MKKTLLIFVLMSLFLLTSCGKSNINNVSENNSKSYAEQGEVLQLNSKTNVNSKVIFKRYVDAENKKLIYTVEDIYGHSVAISSCDLIEVATPNAELEKKSTVSSSKDVSIITYIDHDYKKVIYVMIDSYEHDVSISIGDLK